uniref:Uncharacterized protein n=1 Tax=Chelonoidis abingdonii TaxID=106734 RepID=A0A8C0FYQ2_CHEAB
MSLRKLIQQNRNANFVGYCVSPSYTPYLDPMCSPQMDNRRIQSLANTVGTLPRGRKQVRFQFLTLWKVQFLQDR